MGGTHQHLSLKIDRPLSWLDRGLVASSLRQRAQWSARSFAPFVARSSVVVLCGPNPAFKPTAAMLAAAA